ncbi:MAG: conjugal transfer protein TraN [Rickettsia sp.]|uniref:conjugal transfer protein TraN n=1 Tax=Rickettsia sp. TaxID=789 RepID=UPI00397B210E
MKKGLFKFFLCCPVTLMLALNGSIIFASTNDKIMMQEYFDQAENFKEATVLSNPEDMDPEGSITRSSDDFANLSNMRDQELTHQGANLLNNSEDGAFLIESSIAKSNASSEHAIDNDNALIKQAQEIANDPLKVTEGTYYSATETSGKTTIYKSCTEGGKITLDVIRQLHIEPELIEEFGDFKDKEINISSSDIDPAWTKQVVDSGSAKRSAWNMKYTSIKEKDENVQRGLKNKILSLLQVSNDQIADNITIGYEAEQSFLLSGLKHLGNVSKLHFQFREKLEKFNIKDEYFQIHPESVEELIASHECSEISRICLDSTPKTYFGKYTVNRPCFKEQIKYQCQIEPQNGCRALKHQGCNLIGSTCLQYLGNYCLKWKRDFECHGLKSEMNSMIKDSEIFCLGGECFNPTIERNADIENVSYLSLLNEMKKDMQVNPISVFKGAVNSCRKINIGSFINCCSSMKGWGRNAGLAKCKSEEKSLALKRSKGLCTYVGTYCSTKDPITKRCITKQSSFCCYNSKLAKVFQEQGRMQLGISYGAPQSPNCRGLTTEELQKIDYSKLDLEELFSEMLEDVRSKINKGFSKQIQNQMPKMQSDIKVNDRKALTY